LIEEEGMKIPSTIVRAGNNPYNEDQSPPLFAAFALASKCSSKVEGQPVEKEEDIWFEGAD